MGVSKPLKWRVFERDRFTCRYCGATGVPLEADHVFPESKGGPTVYNNLVAACEKCNREKSNKLGIYPLPVDYLERLSYANRVIAWYEDWKEKEGQAKREAWETETRVKVEAIMAERLHKLEQWRKRRAMEWQIIKLLPNVSFAIIAISTILLLWQIFAGYSNVPAIAIGWSMMFSSFFIVLAYKRLLNWHIKKWDNIPLFVENKK